MHELHRAQAIIDEMRRRNLQGAFKVTVSHLERTFITLEEVKECFELLSKDSEFQGSYISFISKPVSLRCRECGTVVGVSPREIPTRCIECGSRKLTLKGDDELFIEKIERI